MKKILLVFTAVLLATISLSAQNMFLTWNGETLGDTVTVLGEPGDNEIIFQAMVHNMTDKWMKIKVRRNQIEMVDSTSSYFCWGNCFSDDVEESPDSIQIVSGGSSVDTAFSGHYLINEQIGTSLVEYMFYDSDNEDMNVKVLVRYRYWASPEGIAEEAIKGGKISSLYPNPTATVVNIDYDIPFEIESASIRIVNIFGSLVKVSDIEPASNKLTIDISDMEAGIYFYSVLLNNHVYQTKKLIIRK